MSQHHLGRRIQVWTDEATADFAQRYFSVDEGQGSSDFRAFASFGEPGQDVRLAQYRRSVFPTIFGDGGQSIRIDIDYESAAKTQPESDIALGHAALIAALCTDETVSRGACATSDQFCLTYWSDDGGVFVVSGDVDSTADEWSRSRMGVVNEVYVPPIRSALDAAGIVYEERTFGITWGIPTRSTNDGVDPS